MAATYLVIYISDANTSLNYPAPPKFKKNEMKGLQPLLAKVDLCAQFGTDQSNRFPVMMRHIYRDYNLGQISPTVLP